MFKSLPIKQVDKLMKMIIYLICLNFLVPALNWAFDGSNYLSATNGQVITSPTGHPIVIPKKFGDIKTWQQNQGQTIIVIEDLHCNYEVQKNIASLLMLLKNKHGLKLIGQEGSSRLIDTSIISSFPIPKIREQVSDYFMRQGKITGAEYVSANSNQAFLLEGIDDPLMLAKSQQLVKLFLNNETYGLIDDFREILNQIKPLLFNADLLALDTSFQFFREGELDLDRYASQLVRLAKQSNIATTTYQKLVDYLQSKRPADGAASLFQELEQLTQAVKVRLVRDQAEGQLDQLGRRLEVIERLLNISVTVKELKEIRTRRDSFRLSQMIKSMANLAGQVDHTLKGGLVIEPTTLLESDQAINRALGFYQLADQRSTVLVNNLLDKMNQQQEPLAVMISGGFHTAHIIQALKKRHCSYVVITPRLNQQDVLNPYFELLQGKQTKLEKLLAKQQRMMALPSAFHSRVFLGRVLSLFKPLGAFLHPNRNLQSQALSDYLTSHQGIYQNPDILSDQEKRTLGLPNQLAAARTKINQVSKYVIRIKRDQVDLDNLRRLDIFDLVVLPEWVMVHVDQLGQVQQLRQLLSHDQPWGARLRQAAGLFGPFLPITAMVLLMGFGGPVENLLANDMLAQPDDLVRLIVALLLASSLFFPTHNQGGLVLTMTDAQRWPWQAVSLPAMLSQGQEPQAVTQNHLLLLKSPERLKQLTVHDLNELYQWVVQLKTFDQWQEVIDIFLAYFDSNDYNLNDNNYLFAPLLVILMAGFANKNMVEDIIEDLDEQILNKRYFLLRATDWLAGRLTGTIRPDRRLQYYERSFLLEQVSQTALADYLNRFRQLSLASVLPEWLKPFEDIEDKIRAYLGVNSSIPLEVIKPWLDFIQKYIKLKSDMMVLNQQIDDNQFRQYTVFYHNIFLPAGWQIEELWEIIRNRLADYDDELSLELRQVLADLHNKLNFQLDYLETSVAVFELQVDFETLRSDERHAEIEQELNAIAGYDQRFAENMARKLNEANKALVDGMMPLFFKMWMVGPFYSGKVQDLFQNEKISVKLKSEIKEIKKQIENVKESRARVHTKHAWLKWQSSMRSPVHTWPLSVWVTEVLFNRIGRRQLDQANLQRTAVLQIGPVLEPMLILGLTWLIPVMVNLFFGWELGGAARALISLTTTLLYVMLHWGRIYSLTRHDDQSLKVVPLVFDYWLTRAGWLGNKGRLAYWKKIFTENLIFHLPFYVVFTFSLSPLVSSGLLLLTFFWAVLSHWGYHHLVITKRNKNKNKQGSNLQWRAAGLPEIILPDHGEAPLGDILKLLDIPQSNVTGLSYRDDELGIYGYTFSVPKFHKDVRIPRGLELLRELVAKDKWEENQHEFEILFYQSSTSQGVEGATSVPIAIYPKKNIRANYALYHYLIPYDLLQKIGQPDMKPRWIELGRLVDSIQLGLEQYKKNNPTRQIAQPLPGKVAPFIYVEIDINGKRSFFPFDLTVFGKKTYYRNMVKQRADNLFAPRQDMIRSIFVLPPGTYSFGEADHAKFDEAYVDWIAAKFENSVYQEGQKICDLGTGSGFLLWLVANIIKRKKITVQYYAVDIDPFSALAADINLNKIAGLDAVVANHDHLIDDEGIPAFPKSSNPKQSVLFHTIISNAPQTMVKKTDMETRQVRPLSALHTYHDGNQTGISFWQKTVSHLREILEKDGYLLAWNFVETDADGLLEWLKDTNYQVEVARAKLPVTDGLTEINYGCQLLRKTKIEKKASTTSGTIGKLGEMFDGDLEEAYLQNKNWLQKVRLLAKKWLRSSDYRIDLMAWAISADLPIKLSFVCRHNDNRSANAAILAMDRADKMGRKKVKIYSGGFERDEEGGAIQGTKKRYHLLQSYQELLASDYGVSDRLLQAFRSQRFKSSELKTSDFIIVASVGMQKALGKRYPDLVGKLVVMNDFDVRLKLRYGRRFPDPMDETVSQAKMVKLIDQYIIKRLFRGASPASANPVPAQQYEADKTSNHINDDQPELFIDLDETIHSWGVNRKIITAVTGALSVIPSWWLGFNRRLATFGLKLKEKPEKRFLNGRAKEEVAQLFINYYLATAPEVLAFLGKGRQLRIIVSDALTQADRINYQGKMLAIYLPSQGMDDHGDLNWWGRYYLKSYFLYARQLHKNDGLLGHEHSDRNQAILNKLIFNQPTLRQVWRGSAEQASVASLLDFVLQQVWTKRFNRQELMMIYRYCQRIKIARSDQQDGVLLQRLLKVLHNQIKLNNRLGPKRQSLGQSA